MSLNVFPRSGWKGWVPPEQPHCFSVGNRPVVRFRGHVLRTRVEPRAPRILATLRDLKRSQIARIYRLSAEVSSYAAPNLPHRSVGCLRQSLEGMTVTSP